MLIDTHCHLDFDVFDQDREQALERARAGGVARFLNPGVDLENSRNVVALAERFPDVYAAVGVHPNSALTWEAGSLESLEALARHPKVAAVGEIGLDYYRQRAPHELQKQVFQAQLELAGKLDLPVIIHTRNASAEDRQATIDALAMLSDWVAGLADGSPLSGRAGVLHSFSDHAVAAQEAIGLGFYIGITGPVTFKNAPEIQRTVAELPLARLLVETDAPFLTPHPQRGKRNEPAYIGLIADKIAMIHNLPIEVVAQATTANAARLFNWRVNH